MQPQLQQLLESNQAQTRTVNGLFSSRPYEVLGRRPTPDKWSVLEHIEHLSVVNEFYLASIGKAVEKARAAGRMKEGEGPSGGGWMAERLIASQEPPPKMRLRAFKKTRPEEQLEGAQVLERFRAAQGAYEGFLSEADGVDLRAAKFRSPLFALVRLNTMQGFRLIDTHNRRHIWHVEQSLGP